MGSQAGVQVRAESKLGWDEKKLPAVGHGWPGRSTGASQRVV